MRNQKFGSYVLLGLCAAAVALTGVLYAINREETLPVSNQEEILETLSAAPTTCPTQPTETTEPPARETAPKTIRTAAPVDGQTIGSFAMDCLSYNETTRDWRVHNGIDLAAPEGTEVKAAAAGTVEQVFEDDALGFTVVVSHPGGYTTRYANLADSPCVSVGQQVDLGQTLGTVGTSALLETAMDSHVHFSVSYQGTPMEPETFLALG